MSFFLRALIRFLLHILCLFGKYGAELSHVMSDEHIQELWCLVFCRFGDEVVFYRARIWKCIVSSRLHPLLFLAKLLWEFSKYICQQSCHSLWRWQETGISFIRWLTYISTLLNKWRETVAILLKFFYLFLVGNNNAIACPPSHVILTKRKECDVDFPQGHLSGM